MEARTIYAGTILQVVLRADQVALIVMDLPGESTNVLRAGFSQEFTRAIDAIEADGSVLGAVFSSGKPDQFIAGADVRMLGELTTAAAASGLAREGQAALERLSRCSVPVVAAIHGPCLGGGLEVALACRARVASSSPVTRLGLPEVQLGLLPALGGTQRLPSLIGVQAALDLLLTGKQIDAKRAQKVGLVNEVVPASILLDVAAALALSAARPEANVRGGVFAQLGRLVHKEELSELVLAENPLGRKLLFDQARKRLLEKTHGNYPAAERILEVVKFGLGKGLERGLEAEAQAFGELVVSAEARALMSIFFATTELKKSRAVAGERAEAVPLSKLGILGAGLMGAGIAYVTAFDAKLRVRLKDRDDAALGLGLKHVRELSDDRTRSRRVSLAERDAVLQRVTGTTDYQGFADVELVIEAVFEDLGLKRQMLKEIEQVAKRPLIFASNTSSLPISKIAEGAAHPERVIGMHYFSPVNKMPLLEVIVTDRTAPWVAETCVELGRAQGKTVIVVHDGPGFYTTRILGPYMNEAAFLLADGVPIDLIDDALVKWGFPVGPIALLDEVGIDVGSKVAKVLHEAFGERMAAPSVVPKILADQRLGKKNQRGFYLYAGQKKRERQVDPSIYPLIGVKPNSPLLPAQIAERCALQMINEAAHCLGEGILKCARDGDVGAIFGLGFPPFRGGPFRYVDALGIQETLERLRSYETKIGPRFKPAPILEEMARTRRPFYGPNAVLPNVLR